MFKGYKHTEDQANMKIQMAIAMVKFPAFSSSFAPSPSGCSEVRVVPFMFDIGPKVPQSGARRV